MRGYLSNSGNSLRLSDEESADKRLGTCCPQLGADRENVSTPAAAIRLAVYWSMSEYDFQTSAPKDVPDGTTGELAIDGTLRHPDLPTILDLLADDSQQPHEGERNIVASAIWCALQSSTADELPSLLRLVRRFSHEIESRAQLADKKDLSLRGSLELAPVLALCAEIHRVGFVDADGK